MVPPTALPEREDDRHVAAREGLAGVAVEERGHVARSGVQLVGRVVLALLEHDDVRASLGQFLRRGRAARSGADYADVGLDRAGPR